jgi:hypothetical protein
VPHLRVVPHSSALVWLPRAQRGHRGVWGGRTGALTHGELSIRISHAMLRTLAQRRRDMVMGSGWADLPVELLEQVLELLQAGGLGFSQATATVRRVCAAWKTVHDALVTRLVLRGQTTDEAMAMLARRFPALMSMGFKSEYGDNALTDQGMRAVSSLTSLTCLNLTSCQKITNEGMQAVRSLPALTSLDLTYCKLVADEGVRAVSSCTALTFLNLHHCLKVTDQAMRAVSSLPALTTLNLTLCARLTDEAVRELSSIRTLTSLNLRGCSMVTDVGLRSVSSLPALTSLDITYCRKVTAAGVRALRSSTVAPSLHIISRF